MKAKAKQAIQCTALIAAVTVGLGGCSSSSETSEQEPAYVGSTTYDFHFKSLETMAATSDLVIMGRVASVTKGRERYACDSPPGECEPTDENYSGQLRKVTIAVDTVLNDSAPGKIVILEEHGYDREGNPFEMEGAPWSSVGDRGAFFLRRWASQPHDHYYLVHPVGRILTYHSSPNAAGDPKSSENAISFAEGELADHIRNIPSGDLRSTITNAVKTAEMEDIPAQEPLEWLD